MARVPITIDLADNTGIVVPGATATIKKTDGTNASLYAARTGGAPIGNPLTTDASGVARCWVDRGLYRVVYGGGVTRSDDWVGLAAADDAEIDAAWASAVAGNTVGLLAARPATPTTTKDTFFATDVWGGTLYAAKADLSGWWTVSSKNEQQLTLAAVSTATFTGLNGDVDEQYELIFDVVLAGTAAAALFARPNADATNTYSSAGTASDASTVAGQGSASDTGFRFAGSTAPVAPCRVIGCHVIAAKSGNKRVCVGETHIMQTSSTGKIHFGVGSSYPNTANNITTLDLVSTGAGGTMTGTAVLRRKKSPA